MTNNADFDQIRPFRDEEVSSIIAKLCEVPYFSRVLTFLYPNQKLETVIAKLKTIKSIEEFQLNFIIPFLSNLIETTTDGVSASGIENISNTKSYLFVSNHRDIILDSALLNYKLNECGITTTEIAIGDNLLIYEWITDLVKLNKSFVVKRNLPVRQMMEASATLSAFIRNAIVNSHQNIWIAQREGRSKDGNDQTQSSVLKMFNLSGNNDLIANFKELNIVPVSITYEFDPCDYLKAYQFQQKRDNLNYHKSQDDDLTHMSTGLRGRKGHVHFSFGTPICKELDALNGLNKNAQIQGIADIIDYQIHKNYHLWPCNYVAFDILNGNKANADKYTEDEAIEFKEYVNEHISRLDSCDEDFIFQMILRMYANPVINQNKALSL